MLHAGFGHLRGVFSDHALMIGITGAIGRPLPAQIRERPDSLFDRMVLVSRGRVEVIGHRVPIARLEHATDRR